MQARRLDSLPKRNSGVTQAKTRGVQKRGPFLKYRHNSRTVAIGPGRELSKMDRGVQKVGESIRDVTAA